jgi:2-polyprenyl-3-methyl-5-hydroxy-6-metoxy-1,4-benzoquinol methylase
MDSPSARNVLDPLSDEYRAFEADVTGPAFVAALAEQSGTAFDVMQAHIRTSAAEAAQTLRVLSGVRFGVTDRLLEIGAGLGLASCYLTRCGYAITSLEPVGPGFEWHRSLASEVMSLLDAPHRHLDLPAEVLEAETHGTFDVIFSNNVIEHVLDPGVFLSVLSGLAASQGVMVHSCPNYRIPYEPHFGIPLLPGRPGATRWLLPSRIRDSELWQSLNFITAADITSAAEGMGFSVRFRARMLADSVERLAVDPEFSKRHRVLAAVTPVLTRSGFTTLLARLPPTWSTPMEFALWRGCSAAPGRLGAWHGRLRAA